MRQSLFILFSLLCCCGIMAQGGYKTQPVEYSNHKISDSLLVLDCPQMTIKPQVLLQKTNRNFSHSLNVHFTPKDSISKEFLIITTPLLWSSLEKEIRTYAEDIHAIHGYGILVEVVTDATPQQLKSIIVGYGEFLCGAIFIGTFETCWFETSNDFNEENTYRRWPCDLYFMDLDGQWIDEDNNGIYDKRFGNTAPEIFIGRISGEGMASYEDEFFLIKKQLQKSHDFWWKASSHPSDTILNYINSSWNSSFLPQQMSNIFCNSIVHDIRSGNDTIFSKEDYLNRLNSRTYGFTYLAAHSSPSTHYFDDGVILSPKILFFSVVLHAIGNIMEMVHI